MPENSDRETEMHNRALPPVRVVGAGIVGLACALRLLEAGHEVVVHARELPDESTSSVAAAIWYPYLAEPRDRVLAWSIRTLEVLRDELAQDPKMGIYERELIEFFVRPTADPWWRAAVDDLRRINRRDLPEPFVDAYALRVPLVDSSRHLPRLVQRLSELGGSLEQGEVRPGDWSAWLDRGEVAVNCSGLGAARLCDDRQLDPVRGQVVRVTNPGIEHCLLAEEGPYGISYVIPREDDVILGGCAEHGATTLEPCAETSDRILRAAQELEPRLRDAHVLEVKVGLRPYRSSVRLERDADGVVHCYGHGGSGFTLAWGCADEVVKLVQRPARKPKR